MTEQQNFNVDQLLAALKAGKVLVKFTKMDGSIREGTFTLNEALIEKTGWTPKPLKEGQKPRAPVMGLVSVMELPAAQWRSFRAANVLEWKSV